MQARKQCQVLRRELCAKYSAHYGGAWSISRCRVLLEYWPETFISYSKLSKSDTGRLQRAFCRFESYELLFARCSSEIDRDLQDCAKLVSFLKNLQISRSLRSTAFGITYIVDCVVPAVSWRTKLLILYSRKFSCLTKKVMWRPLNGYQECRKSGRTII